MVPFLSWFTPPPLPRPLIRKSWIRPRLAQVKRYKTKKNKKIHTFKRRLKCHLSEMSQGFGRQTQLKISNRIALQVVRTRLN